MLGWWAACSTVGEPTRALSRAGFPLSSEVPLPKGQQQPVLLLVEFCLLPQKLPPPILFLLCDLLVSQYFSILFENQKQGLNPSVLLQIGLQFSLYFSKGNCKKLTMLPGRSLCSAA